MKMDVKIVVAFFMVGLFAEGHAQLYCYVCEDCADGNNLAETFLVSCSGEEATTATLPSSSTELPVTPPVETIPPTSPPTESSTSQTNSTSEQPTQPTTVPITEPSTEPNTEPPTQPTTQQTNPPSEPTTPEVASTLSTVTVPESPITTTSVIPVTESTIAPTEITTATEPSTPPSTTGRPTATPLSEPSLQRLTSVKQTGYNCYVLKNGTHHVNRGCVVASKNPNDMCRIANDNVLPTECRVCDTDKCNSSSRRVVLSVFLLLFSMGTILSL